MRKLSVSCQQPDDDVHRTVQRRARAHRQRRGEENENRQADLDREPCQEVVPVAVVAEVLQQISRAAKGAIVVDLEQEAARGARADHEQKHRAQQSERGQITQRVERGPPCGPISRGPPTRAPQPFQFEQPQAHRHVQERRSLRQQRQRDPHGRQEQATGPGRLVAPRAKDGDQRQQTRRERHVRGRQARMAQ